MGRCSKQTAVFPAWLASRQDGHHLQISAAGDDPSERSDRVSRHIYRLAKELLDVGMACVCLLVLSPLMLVIALAIKLDSDGPVFFVQERVGYDPETGQQTIFKMLKFRSMRRNSDDSVHREYVSGLIQQNAGLSAGSGSLKLSNDSRVTKVGRILRKLSLDELPQLFNVLRGEMSLVGPRPALPYEVAVYDEWQRMRLRALPGMTGWWQVKARNRVSFDDMVCLDIYYIEHGSFWLDLWIMLMTPWAVISGRGAG